MAKPTRTKRKKYDFANPKAQAWWRSKAPPADRLAAMETVIAALDAALRQAIERKPNMVLTQLVYQLKMTRVELAAVQEQLAANNVILERYARAPVLDAAAGSLLPPHAQ